MQQSSVKLILPQLHENFPCLMETEISFYFHNEPLLVLNLVLLAKHLKIRFLVPTQSCEKLLLALSYGLFILSADIDQLRSHCMDFREILRWRILLKSVGQGQVWFKMVTNILQLRRKPK
jgi:hypothetical protein